MEEPTRSRLDAFASTLAEQMIRFRWLVILACIAAAGFIAMGVQNLEFSNNYRTFFSKENPELQNFEAFQATYTKSDNFLFVIAQKNGGDVFNNQTLEAIGYLTEQGWQIPYASRVDSVTNFQYTYADGDELIVEDLVPIPGASSDAELAAQREAALAEPILKNQLVTSNAKATAVNVTLQYPEKSLAEVPEAVAAARALRKEIKDAYPNLDVYLTGTSMLNNAFSEAVQADFGTLIPAMILIIIATTAIAVRSLWATLATILVIVLSTMIAMGWAGFVGIKLAGPSPSAVIVILTLAIADSIHILLTIRSGMRKGLGKRDAIVESMRINFLAVSITSITTIIGFMALNFSDAPPFRDFGNISAVGIFAAWFLSITMLPALLAVTPYRVKQVADSESMGRNLRAFSNFVVKNNKLLFLVTGAIAFALIAFIPKNIFSDQFRLYFDKRIEFRAETDASMEHFGFYPMEFSVNAGEAGGVSDPDYLERLERFTEWLREYPGVTHVYSVADIMKRLNKNLNADDPDYYRIPEDRELSAQYLLLFELSLPYGLDLNDRINIDKSATRVTATLDGNISTPEIRQFLEASEQWFDQNAPDIKAIATGPQVMFTFIAQRNVESMIRGTITAILAIALIMVFALRSIRIGLLSMVPNGLPILAAFGAWGLIVGEVGFSVAAVAAISLGIVIDDTVHFLTKYTRARREKGLNGPDSIRYAFETVGQAIIVNTLILGAGFSILTLSAFKINAELGLLTTLSIGFALVLDFLFLPALLLMTSKKRAQDEVSVDNASVTGSTI